MITYEDKVALYENTDVPNVNKVTAGDMNEIKNSVNGIVESNIFKNLFNVGDAKITANTGLNFNKTNNQILINGSSTKETSIFLDSPSANKDKEGIILKAGTYTATIKKVSGSLANNPISFYLRKSDGTNIYDGTVVFSQIIEVGVSDGTTYSSTFTLTEETRLHWMGYFGRDLRTFNNLVLQFKIEESPTPTPYMPWAGYIVESGSNDNGSWIKYSDGTMICRGGKTLKDITFTQVATGINYSVPQTLSFPQQFISYDDIGMSVTCRTSNLAWVSNVLPNISNFTFDIVNSSTNTRDVYVTWLAIGRWK